ncbi:uncharacterized protein LOC111865817 [Cryptotermes secundus]|uniref:uncharacterized protein LOC111865817 n=1 Tax=Cryptotermes secundus TaxID=105785 RepID=UPI000CD7AAD7|nr:uncharacterized protein LOC111865817 [Cryptotermes secundus]
MTLHPRTSYSSILSHNQDNTVGDVPEWVTLERLQMPRSCTRKGEQIVSLIESACCSFRIKVYTFLVEMAKFCLVLFLACALMLVAAQRCPPIGRDTFGVCGGTFCSSNRDCSSGICCPSPCGGKLCTSRQG